MIDWQPWLNDGQQLTAPVFTQSLFPLLRSPLTPPRYAQPPADVRRDPISALHRASIAATRRHARRLAALTSALGRHIDLSEDDVALLRVGSLLHDVGKNSLPPQILFKCGRLTPEEFATVKFHPIIGDVLCAGVSALRSVRPIVRHHHERLDGSGYPDGLRGNDVPFLAQIVGVVDVYDALVTCRPYKPAFDPRHAFDILRREVQLGWRRADLVAALFEVIESGSVEWMSTAAAD